MTDRRNSLIPSQLSTKAEACPDIGGKLSVLNEDIDLMNSRAYVDNQLESARPSQTKRRHPIIDEFGAFQLAENERIVSFHNHRSNAPAVLSG